MPGEITIATCGKWLDRMVSCDFGTTPLQEAQRRLRHEQPGLERLVERAVDCDRRCRELELEGG
jgi:hypothetical protein